MSTFLNRNPYRRSRRASVTAGFDPVLTGAVALLLVIGTLLVYAATRGDALLQEHLRNFPHLGYFARSLQTQFGSIGARFLR